MGTKQRILTIRLLERLAADPVLSKKFGLSKIQEGYNV